MTQFSDLGLSAPLLKALESENYVTPTPIQAQSIPHVLAGKDLLGIAQTGTGKTAAFLLPILEKLDERAVHEFMREDDDAPESAWRDEDDLLGELDEIVDALTAEDQAARLAADE